MQDFFTPKSIAVIGASRSVTKVGHVILENLLESRYKGYLYPVNPNAEKILSLKCYRSVLDIKNKIDMAMIAVPADAVLKVVTECAKKGIKSIVMVTSGFSEIGNKEAEEKIKSLIRRYGIRLIGPNCLGVIDTYNNLNTIFLPKSRLKLKEKGGISLICQSGAVGSTAIDVMSEQGIGFSKFVSYGNALDIDETDLLEYLAKDKTTKVICMYVEEIKNGRKFLKVAKEVSKEKPIVCLKGGITEKGNKATLSHTASLAGAPEVYGGAFKQAHVIKADNLRELFNFAKIFEHKVKPKNSNVQIITNGGGFGVLCVDVIDSLKMNVAELTSDSKNRLKKILPNHAIIENPLDLTGSAADHEYELAIETCLKDNNVGIILVVVLVQTPLLSDKMIDILAKANNKKIKPIVVVSTGSKYSKLFIEKLEEKGLPCYIYPEEAVSSINALCKYYKA